MISTVIGDTAVIADKNNIEKFTISMVSRKFQSDSYAHIGNGKGRGMKICGGEFFYAKELLDSKK